MSPWQLENIFPFIELAQLPFKINNNKKRSELSYGVCLKHDNIKSRRSGLWDGLGINRTKIQHLHKKSTVALGKFPQIGPITRVTSMCTAAPNHQHRFVS